MLAPIIGVSHCSTSLGKLILARALQPNVDRLLTQIREDQCGFHSGRGTLDQLCTLARTLEDSWYFSHPVCTCFVELMKTCDHAPCSIMLGVLEKYGVLAPLLWPIWCLDNQSESCFHILSEKPRTFSMGVCSLPGCVLSLILFLTFMDGILQHS